MAKLYIHTLYYFVRLVIKARIINVQHIIQYTTVLTTKLL